LFVDTSSKSDSSGARRGQKVLEAIPCRLGGWNLGDLPPEPALLDRGKMLEFFENLFCPGAHDL
jgi:hypothetical protein